MKKLSLILLCLLLVACGTTKQKETNKETENKKEKPVQTIVTALPNQDNLLGIWESNQQYYAITTNNKVTPMSESIIIKGLNDNRYYTIDQARLNQSLTQPLDMNKSLVYYDQGMIIILNHQETESTFKKTVVGIETIIEMNIKSVPYIDILPEVSKDGFYQNPGVIDIRNGQILYNAYAYLTTDAGYFKQIDLYAYDIKQDTTTLLDSKQFEQGGKGGVWIGRYLAKVQDRFTINNVPYFYSPANGTNIRVENQLMETIEWMSKTDSGQFINRYFLEQSDNLYSASRNQLNIDFVKHAQDGTSDIKLSVPIVENRNYGQIKIVYLNNTYYGLFATGIGNFDTGVVDDFQLHVVKLNFDAMTIEEKSITLPGDGTFIDLSMSY